MNMRLNFSWKLQEDDAYDEVPFENEFQDDEEGVGGLGLNEDEKGAMDDEEAKELEVWLRLTACVCASVLSSLPYLTGTYQT